MLLSAATFAMDNSGNHKVVRLEDYTPPAWLVDALRLEFVLGDEATEVRAELDLRRNPANRAAENLLRLDGEHLELLGIAIDGEALAAGRYRLTERELTIAAPPQHFTLATHVRIHPEANTELSGLYKSAGNFCTQCEAEGFRHITYFPDRPDVLARFTTRIEAAKDACPVLLSNGNLVDSGTLAGGRHYAVWEDPFPKPAYLFALVAGRLACREDDFVTASGRKVALRLYVESHNLERTAHAMASLKRAMRWDEENYGREYDLDVLMLVAVDDFNMGAMENKGLNIFNSRYVLADPDIATDQDFAAIESVVGHEYFHNWTGDRVTLRDWFQLSLKEGLTVFREQGFSADMGSAAVKRIRDVRTLRAMQFAEDAGPMAHPVRPDHYLEINNFYTATVYEKGAELLRMYRTLLGVEGFRRGMDLYFERHDGQAVTTDDFRAAMSDANGVDLSQFARWYEVSGTPRLEVAGEYDVADLRYTLHVRQVHADTPGQPAAGKPPLLIPLALALLGPDGEEQPLRLHGETETASERVLWLRDFDERFVFEDLPEHPTPSLLRNFSAPVRLEYPYSDADLAFLAARDSDPFNRWDAAQTLVSRVLMNRAGEKQHREAAPPASLVDAWRALLADGAGEPAVIAETLSLPTETELARKFERVDVEALHMACGALKSRLAAALQKELRAALERNAPRGAYRRDAPEVGRRRLHGVILDYFGALDSPDESIMLKAAFDSADNMSDRLAALGALAAQESAERSRALDEFRARFDRHPLVLDKWFALQAVSPPAGALDRVRALMSDPAFNLRNPNRVRSLIGSFVHNNHFGFHVAGGAAYRFAAEQVLALDALNPQVAARIVTCFSHWRRYDEARRSAMRTELERIASAPRLSRDVCEIVARSLA
ncbi:MAG TPA: aminopeptidase N [Gammaproteobacteria bacterium]|nr:aminopeptidase N [Gammaproteobacteria bacterium]